MKINKEDRGVTSSGGEMRSGQYTIAASPKMFKMLSSGVYKDLILAFIREICANCADEHRMSGNKRPFEVKLPTMLSPEMSFKDYGRGMSEDTVMELFTTYGYSTKDDLNSTVNGEAIIGGFGVGSKSPFSYTDTFTIESRYNGEKSTYAAHIDNVGIPSIKRITAVPTDEPNGLTIKVPIKKGDEETCSEKLGQVLEFYSNPPIVKGNPSFAIKKTKYAIDERQDGYAVIANGGYHGKSRVIIGENALALDLDILNLQHGDRYNYSSMDFFMPMGSVEVAVSREELSYEPETIKAIKDFFQGVKDKIKDRAIKKLEVIKNEYLLAQEIKKVTKSSRMLDLQSFYDHFKLNDSIPVGNVKCYEENSYTHGGKLRRFDGHRFYRGVEDTYFVVVDEQRACDIKTRQWASKLIKKLKDDDSYTDPMPSIYQIPGDKWDNIYKAIGKPPSKFIIKTSEIEHTPVSKAKKESGEITTYNVDLGLNQDTVSMTSLDASSIIGKYVVINNSEIILNGVTWSRHMVVSLLSERLTDNVYLCYKTSVPLLEELGWTEGSSELLSQLKSSMETFYEISARAKLKDAIECGRDIQQWSNLANSPMLIQTPYNKGVIKMTKGVQKVLDYLDNKYDVHKRRSMAAPYSYRLSTSSREYSTKIFDRYNITLDPNHEYKKDYDKLKAKKVDTIDEEWIKLFPMLSKVSAWNMHSDNNILDYLSKWQD